MSYYPLLAAPGCSGWTTLCNFPPNNWELRATPRRIVHVTWTEGEYWASKSLGVLEKDQARTFTRRDIEAFVPEDALPLFSLSANGLPERSDTLPATEAGHTAFPAWRATLGLSSGQAQTSYQGEVDPFPPKGSLLTFCPFIQFGTNVENYALFVNIEQSPRIRNAAAEIYDSEALVRRDTFDIRSNRITIRRLDDLGFSPTDLPVVACKTMAVVPLYFSRTADGTHLSLEHTHPPASYVIHGNRWEAQKILKNRWFERMAQACK